MNRQLFPDFYMRLWSFLFPKCEQKKLVFILAIDYNLLNILAMNRDKKLMMIAISAFNVLNSDATTYIWQ